MTVLSLQSRVDELRVAPFNSERERFRSYPFAKAVRVALFLADFVERIFKKRKKVLTAKFEPPQSPLPTENLLESSAISPLVRLRTEGPSDSAGLLIFDWLTGSGDSQVAEV
jgi:hypothetical protein